MKRFQFWSQGISKYYSVRNRQNNNINNINNNGNQGTCNQIATLPFSLLNPTMKLTLSQEYFDSSKELFVLINPAIPDISR